MKSLLALLSLLVCFSSSGQDTLYSYPFSNVQHFTEPIDSLDFLWLEEISTDCDQEVEIDGWTNRFSLAWHSDFELTLVVENAQGFSAYSFAEDNYLRLYSWSFELQQLNDGSKEIILSSESGYGKGWNTGSFEQNESAVYVLDLDRERVLAQIVDGSFYEEWEYAFDLNEEEGEGNENAALKDSAKPEGWTDEEWDLGERLNLYWNLERTVVFENGQLLIETHAAEGELDTMEEQDGCYAWDEDWERFIWTASVFEK